MNVLIVGSGGREHAMAWKAAQSRRLQTLYRPRAILGRRGWGNVTSHRDDQPAIGGFARDSAD